MNFSTTDNQGDNFADQSDNVRIDYIPQFESSFTEQDITVFCELQSLVGKFIVQYDQQMSLEFRVLDIVSEVGELATEFSLKFSNNLKTSQEIFDKIQEEIGDVSFAVFCLINIVGISMRTFDFSNFKKIALNDGSDFFIVSSFLALSAQTGKVAKALLKMTDYGKRESETLSPKMISETESLFSYLLSLAMSLNIDLNISVRAVLKKYENRAVRGGSFSSENELVDAYNGGGLGE